MVSTSVTVESRLRVPLVANAPYPFKFSAHGDHSQDTQKLDGPDTASAGAVGRITHR